MIANHTEFRCCLCDSQNLARGIENYQNNGTNYSLHECLDCKVQFWTPFQNPGGDWYEKDERYAGANKKPTKEPTLNHRHIIDYLKPFAGKVLDVGCGTGNFLSWAKDHGWSVWGIDFDRNSIESCRKYFNIDNVEVIDVVEYSKNNPNKENFFDLITFFDVFEHIDNHEPFVSAVKKMLKPDGYVAMSMPYRLGNSWLKPHDLPPRHLTRWEENSISNFFERHGFTVKFIKKRNASFNYILMKLRFRYGKALTFDLVKKVEKIKNKIPNKNNNISSFNLAHLIARVKDLLLFGLPTLILWAWFTAKRTGYIDLYVIARKNG